MVFDVLRRKIGRLFSLSSAWMLICGLFAVPAFSQTLRLDITEGQIAPIPVAIADFTGLDGTPSNVGRQISQVIADDLVMSRAFSPRLIQLHSLLHQHHRLCVRTFPIGLFRGQGSCCGFSFY